MRRMGYGMILALVLAVNAGAGTYGGGSGTAGDPYRISTTAHWTSLIASPGDWGKSFILTANLDFGLANFNPVGNGTTFFTGVLDGAGHTLSNFRVRVGQVPIDNVGLFGVVSGGQIKNLGVVNATVRGSSYVGALVGDNNGTITSCYATGSVSGTTSVGGLAGYNSGTITACYATVAASGGTQVGGLVGVNFSTINSCYSTGAVSGTSPVGGLVGVSYSGVLRSFWDVQTSGQDYSAGGYPTISAQMKTQSTFTDAGWDFFNTWWMHGGYPRLMWEMVYGSLQVTIEPSGAAAEGAQWRRVGSSGWFNSGQIETSVPAWSWDVEFKPTVHWRPPERIQVAVAANGLAQLTAAYTRLYSGGSGTAGDPYWIGSVADWQDLTLRSVDWGKNFILTADLDFGEATITPVAPDTDPTYGNGFQGTPFTGIFDGAGHTLSHFTIQPISGFYVGLFGVVDGGQVKNLGLVKATIQGMELVGGLVGSNSGTITACYTTEAVMGSYNYFGGLVGKNDGTIISCYAAGTVSGGSSIGGLVGDNYGTIFSCYAAGTVIGDFSVGGLVGNNYGAISSCYAADTAIGLHPVGGLVGYNGGGTITSCYATGIINGNDSFGHQIGGLVGAENVGDQINGCFWDTLTSRTATSYGGTGKTTAEMKRQSTFTPGWDFANVWGIDENRDYPFLRNVTHPKGSADLNGDGKVDLADFALFAQQWMK